MKKKKGIVSKKTVKKVEAAAKSMAKKAGVFAKKANKEAGKTVRVLQKEWKESQPQRERYIKDFKKVGSDVIRTIKKDVGEIRRDGTKSKAKSKKSKR